MRTKEEEELRQAQWEKLVAIQRRGLLEQIAYLQKKLDDLPTKCPSEEDLSRQIKMIKAKAKRRHHEAS